MEQVIAATKIADELIKNGLLLQFNKQDVVVHLERLYAIGFDEGRKQNAHGKCVIQLDVRGNILAEYDNMAAAARKVQLTKHSISKAVNGSSQTAGGFYWRLKTI